MKNNSISNLVKAFTMNQMNPMYLIDADWMNILHFPAHKAQKAENTMFCTIRGLECGSFKFIWFIGLGLTWLSLFFNEPNVHECSKGCSMGVFALSVLGGWNGPNLTDFAPVFGRSNELEKGSMYIKFIGCTSRH